MFSDKSSDLELVRKGEEGEAAVRVHLGEQRGLTHILEVIHLVSEEA